MDFDDFCLLAAGAEMIETKEFIIYLFFRESAHDRLDRGERGEVLCGCGEEDEGEEGPHPPPWDARFDDKYNCG